MTACAECRSTVNPSNVAVYVPADGTVALTLCLSCQTAYPRSRQYSPRGMPSRSRVRLDGGDGR